MGNNNRLRYIPREAFWAKIFFRTIPVPFYQRAEGKEGYNLLCGFIFVYASGMKIMQQYYIMERRWVNLFHLSLKLFSGYKNDIKE